MLPVGRQKYLPAFVPHINLIDKVVTTKLCSLLYYLKYRSKTISGEVFEQNRQPYKKGIKFRQWKSKPRKLLNGN